MDEGVEGRRVKGDTVDGGGSRGKEEQLGKRDVDEGVEGRG